MVITFEKDANFFWVEMIMENVVLWAGISRLELTYNAPFKNNKIKQIIERIRY